MPVMVLDDKGQTGDDHNGRAHHHVPVDLLAKHGGANQGRVNDTEIGQRLHR